MNLHPALTASTPRIAKQRSPNFPQFLFEYHADSSRVYLIQIPGRWEPCGLNQPPEFVPDQTKLSLRGEIIAEHCESEAQFFAFTQTFLRGVRLGCDKPDSNSRLQGQSFKPRDT